MRVLPIDIALLSVNCVAWVKALLAVLPAF